MTGTVALKRRGRPRQFDRDEALRAALQIFWTKGYDGTSMALLGDAMGMASPSIYAAFGSKEELFIEVLQIYIADEVDPVWQALDDNDDLEDAIRQLLFGAIDAFVGRGVPRGCLVILGGGLLAPSQNSVRTMLQAERERYRERLAGRIVRAIEDGALHSANDPATLSSCVLAFLGGLAIEAIDGEQSEQLKNMASLFCRRMVG